MRIAQVAPLIESVPPRYYGGTERVVSHLTEQLVRHGHQVTLFASGDSETSAELVSPIELGARLGKAADTLSCYVLQLELVRQRASEFDLVHFHDNLMYFPLVRAGFGAPTVSTLHGRLDWPIYSPLFSNFTDVPVISISMQQRLPLPQAAWVGNVYHGLPMEDYSFHERPDGDYVAFIGRICPEKRPDRAIEIAEQAGVRLRIAGKVDPVDAVYFRDCIRPLLQKPHVEYLGEIGEAEKRRFLGNARGVLFPIDWPEAFGLVMIEAMACGTPVIAWRCGSVPEVIDDGLTGLIVDSVEAAVEAVSRLSDLDRAIVRTRCEERFSARRMTNDYVSIYRTLIERWNT